ncbi:c-type cytochrome [Mariprofundus erugo]|nr:cytochrome c [Mariprofundus erugo]
MAHIIELPLRALKAALLLCATGWFGWGITVLMFDPAAEVQAAEQQQHASMQPERGVDGRWYSHGQVALGHAVFESHCARCHGERAQGLVANWRQRLPDGSYPPPPLDGSAHAWHHALPMLLQIVQQGGARYDGKMPGFGDQLSKEEQLAAIAWFQSLWPDETYRQWASPAASSDMPFAPPPQRVK